jgi:hypothetical protein
MMPKRRTLGSGQVLRDYIRETSMTTNVQPARQGADAPVRQLPAARGAARLLAAIDDLVPELAARSAAIESASRIPADITDRLQRMGFSEPCYRAAMAGWS